jgi:IclR family KDG regulon transcriptional repressor
MTREAEPARGGVQAADTVLAVLETVAYAEEPVGVTQVAGAVGIAKSAAFRHLRTLLDRGYLVQDPTSSRFRLGPKVFLLGRLAPSGHDLAATVQPAMREARDASGLSVVVSTPTPQGAFVLATVPGTQAIDIGVRVGSSLALHASAQGKVFLAFGPKGLLDRVLSAPRPGFTPRTITGAAELAEEIERVRAQGYAAAPEEVLLGVNALAAAVRDPQGAVVASVALVGSIQHIAREPDARLVRIVLDLARRASRLIAGPNGRRAGI